MPVQKPHVPVIIGGAKGKIYERIATVGDGWFAPITDPKALGEALAELKSVCRKVGRNYADIEITTMWAPQMGLDSIKVLEDLGVSRVTTFADPTDAVNSVKRLGEQVIAKL